MQTIQIGEQLRTDDSRCQLLLPVVSHTVVCGGEESVGPTGRECSIFFPTLRDITHRNTTSAFEIESPNKR